MAALDQTTPTGSTSRSLVARVQCGDSDAWRRLVQLYGPLLFEWCRRWSLQESDAADIAQEVFRAVAANIGRFRRGSSVDSFTGWLYTIALNSARAHWRHHAKREGAIGGTDFQDRMQHLPARLAASSDLSGGEMESAEQLLRRRALQLVREETRPDHWRAFERTVLDEQEPAEVAAELGLSPDAVRQVKCRLLKKLRDTLDDLRGPDS